MEHNRGFLYYSRSEILQDTIKASREKHTSVFNIDVVGTKDYYVYDCERNYGKRCLNAEAYLNGGCN